MFSEPLNLNQRGSRNSSKSLQSVHFPKLISVPRKKNYPICAFCGLIFQRLIDLKNHLTESQWLDYQQANFSEKFSCRECCLFFDTKIGLKKHNGKVHITKYKYSKCPECKKKFNNKYAVKFHVKQVHQKATRQECPNCKKVFYNKYLVITHLTKCRETQD